MSKPGARDRAIVAAAWSSAITDTDDSRVYLRGRAVDELLVGPVSFGGVLLLLWTGQAPSEEDAALVEACLVASVDHGPTAPSALSARLASSTRREPIACLAGGLLAMTEYHGAGVTSCMELLARAPEDGSLDTWASTETATARSEGRRIPGIGHRSHVRDLRAERLLSLIPAVSDVSGPAAAARALAAAVSEHAGRDMPVNIDGAVAACLQHVGLAPPFGNLLFAIARSGGLAAHIVEERTRERPMRTIDPTAVSYDGPGSGDVTSNMGES